MKRFLTSDSSYSGDNVGLAAKAACLAGAINEEESPAVLEIAAHHPEAVVRVAAAASARNLTNVSASLVMTFLDDPDPGVRKWGLKTLEAHQPEGIKGRVETIMNQDPERGLRELAREIVGRLN